LFDAVSPRARPPSRFFGASVVAHAAAIVLLITLRSSPAVRDLPAQAWRVTLIAPPPDALPKPRIARTSPPTPPAPPPPAPPSPSPRVVREFHPQIATARPPPARIELAPISMPDVLPEAPRVVLPAAELPHLSPIAPRPLKTDNFEAHAADTHVATAIPAPAIISKLAGFSGIEMAERAPTHAIAATGSFDTASAAADRTTSHPGSTRVSGFSDASSASAASSSGGTISGRAISSGGFGDSTVGSKTPGAAHKPDPVSALTAVEILFKPRPVYTEEARAHRIEGEVLLEMQFGAAGEVRILRVVRGLGHGLDESAITAARAIRFRPAQRNGAPVDSGAIVHIVFQLAY